MPPRAKQVVLEPGDPGEEPRRLSRPRTPKKVVVDVTAVLVAHDGIAWLADAIDALVHSTHVPAHVVCVDTGSTDGSAELLEERFDEVLKLPRETGYGTAVQAALSRLDATEPATAWVWLLHDDVAVEPTTLQQLITQVEISPAAALLGPKVRDWDDPRVLVEIGLTTDAAGHRETGLERREYDQGQHDQVRDVLAVGTAAALVRRDVWDLVGGLDPELPVFRDDLDLGWKVNATGHRVLVVPDARVRHARASTTGQRVTDAAPGRATGTDRKHALYVLLAHATTPHLIGLVPRLLLATILRSIALVLTRQLAAAGDEWRALFWLVGHAGELHRARRTRSRLRIVPVRQLRALFAPRLVRIRARFGAVADWLGGTGSPMSNPLGALGDPGPDADSDFSDELGLGGQGFVRRLLARPGVQLVLGLSVITVVAERSLLFSAGALKGGALLGAPRGASDLWASYATAWHDVVVGSSAASPPLTAALAVLSSITLGRPSLAISLLVLASVPLAGLTAYVAATRLVRHLYLRLWAAATWALLPVATGAVAAGRLDAAAVQVMLPLLALWGGQVLTLPPRAGGWSRAWALGLAIGVTSAFAPLLWPLSAAVLLAGALVNLLLSGGRRRALTCLIGVVAPFGVLLPWSWQAIAHPVMFLVSPQVADFGLPAWHLALLWPGGPGLTWPLVTLGLVLAALLGTVRESFRALALGCWGIALLSLLAAALLSRTRVDGQPVWPGTAVQLAGVALLVAALVAANGARSRLVGTSFGWRQLAAVTVAVLAALTPVVCAGAWVVRGADDPVQRDSQQLLPAFAAAEIAASPGLRALILSTRADGRLGYELTDSDGGRLDLVGVPPPSAQRRALDAVVADLASPRGSDAAEALSTRAVRYVGLTSGPGSEELAAVLDAQVGLVRRTTGRLALWQVVAPTSRLLVLSPPLAGQALTGVRAPAPEQLRVAPPTSLPAGSEGARATVAPGPDGRVLVLADAADSGWVAELNGHRLPARRAWGWAQAFALPREGGALVLSHGQASRQAWLGVEAVVLLVVSVLAAPGRRRRRGLETYTGDDIDSSADRDQRVPLAAL